MSLKDAPSVSHLLLERVALTPNVMSFQYFRPTGWQTETWAQTLDKVRQISCGLRSLGIQDEERVAIMSGTRVEWIHADLAIGCASAATTTIYPSTTPDDFAFIINDSGTRMVFAESAEHVKKLAAKRSEIPGVVKVITFDGAASEDGWVITFEKLMEAGREWDKANPGKFEEIAKSVKKDAIATLIYTSGTTGKPKGVVLTHDCWTYEAEGMDAVNILRADDLQYLWLPLSHVFGKVLQVGQLRIGYSTAVDGRIDKLVENLGVIKPTFVAAVPRIFEKVHNKVVQGAKDAGGAKWKIFQWALEVGREASREIQAGRQPGGLLSVKFAIANKLVFSKIRDRFGGRVRLFISGSAPLSRYLAEFFHAAGLPIMEGYGLTESSAASCVNLTHKYRFGTVGMPLPGTTVKIAEDGEILIKGRGIMRGYNNNPAATAEAINKDGWLCTGDIGVVEDGFVRITDRKKDLIKTSGGKYVAPQALEGRFKSVCPYVSQIVVHGDNRNFCSALITLDEEATKKWAKDNGLTNLEYGDLAKNPRVIALFQEHVDLLNKELASYESIKKFVLLEKDLTEAEGDLTPSLKVKRKAVEKKHKERLDAFYAGTVADV